MNIAEEFNLLWINILDEIMIEWFNKYVPVFMCVGCKTHPFGNKRHTICCGLTSIFCRLQIVEGKYFNQKLGQNEYSDLGKTVSLMLRLCKTIFVTGKDVVLKSDFCVANVITKL